MSDQNQFHRYLDSPRRLERAALRYGRGVCEEGTNLKIPRMISVCSQIYWTATTSVEAEAGMLSRDETWRMELATSPEGGQREILPAGEWT